jgi:hypothetical protein
LGRSIGPILWVFVSAMVAIGGISAIRSGGQLNQLIGWIALAGAAIIIASAFFMSGGLARVRKLLGVPPKPGADELVPAQAARCTLAERLVPIVLTAIAILMVAAFAVWTAWTIGLW